MTLAAPDTPEGTLVMQMDSGPHSGMGGRIEVLKFEEGTAVGRSDGAFNGRPITEGFQLGH